MSLITFEEARSRLAAAASPAAARACPLADALGHRLAEPVVADVDQPPGDVSAMDGYAVRHADLKGDPLDVEFEIQAGDAPKPLSPGKAARIFTGALLPPGADTIIQQEKATRSGERVTLETLPKGSHVRRGGEIFAKGSTVLDAGLTLTPGLLAIAASAGAARVTVTPRPSLAFVSTGSELVATDAVPGAGQIRDSNGPQLTALATEARLPVAFVGHAVDEIDALVDTLRRAFEKADVVVTAGGVSVGDYDLVPDALSRLGGDTLFHGVRVRPGKPILVGRVGEKWLVGLPGNPVAVAVGWRVFVRPLAETLAGDRGVFDEPPLHARLTHAVSNPSPRLLLRPVSIRIDDGALVADIGGWKGSHDIVGAGAANGLLAIPEETSVDAGGRLPFFPLPWSPFTPVTRST